MAINENRRINPLVLQADRTALVAIQNMGDYMPANPDFSTEALTSAYTMMEAARIAEINAQNALDAARDAALRAEWNFHNAMLGAKDQVIAQYGVDSNAVQALGLKKKSDRRRPARRVAALAED